MTAFQRITLVRAAYHVEWLRLLNGTPPASWHSLIVKLCNPSTE